MTPTLLSIGHGYAAQAARAFLPADWQIHATTRSAARAQDFVAGGLTPVIWESAGDPGALRAAVAGASHILMSVAPGAQGDPALAVLADAPAPGLRWVGYLSASSVYGDTGGDWIGDDAPANPGTDRGQARLAAESGWTRWAGARGAGAALIRIAGIYGPGRSVFDALAQGRAQRVVKPGQVFNRIHAEDLGQIIAAAAVRQARGPILASDLEPAPPQDLITHACALLGRAPPPEIPFDAATLSPMARSFYSENKRLRPQRLDELGVRLRYPTWRQGLAALKPET